MNLSSLVHTGKSQVEQKHPSQVSRSRNTMASSLMIKPFETQEDGQKKNFTRVTAPQPPPSPPADESPKFSLPSISSLFGLADTSTFQEQGLYSQKHAQKNVNYELGQPYNHSATTNFRGVLPPTPPLHSDSSFGGRQSSPSCFSNSGRSLSSAPTYFFAPNSPPHSVSEVTIADSYSQRQHLPSPSFEGRIALPAQIRNYSRNGSQDRVSSQNSAHSFYSNLQKSPPLPQSGIYGQRPLPQQFPPPIIPLSVPLNSQSAANPWQHHHYISPSSAASFPQSQDRYICQTCNKAFSRPSSLRIHSHSHTGEKPFKCPHQGCGKAFSVRSNMKRHERGCHSFEGSATGTA